MKTDVIKEALESVKKEDPKLYEDVVEYISSNKNKTGVHPEGVYHEHNWPNIIGPMHQDHFHIHGIHLNKTHLVYSGHWLGYICSIN